MTCMNSSSTSSFLFLFFCSLTGVSFFDALLDFAFMTVFASVSVSSRGFLFGLGVGAFFVPSYNSPFIINSPLPQTSN